MPDLTVWPTDGADGSVSSEARWRKMARHWVPSGVVPASVDTLTGQLAPTLVAGPAIQVANGGCWLDGHYAELPTQQTVPVTANGLLVVRFTPGDNRTELLYRDAASAPTQTLATFELAIAKMTAGAMTDQRLFAKQGRDGFQRPGAVVHGITALPCTNGSQVTLSWQAGWASVLWAADNMFNAATEPTKLTARTAGLFSFAAYTSWAGNVAGRRATIIRLNGTLTISEDQRTALAYTAAPAAVCTADAAVVSVWPMGVGDYVELCIYQDSGVSLNINRFEFSAVALSY
jgi:hypothetical protein